ncbi:MAG: bifunctional pyr operon transcriptional regulator/uracil phosphoribosyltransferase PyrR [Candidatus Margulisiibacteriota bacterium]
MVKPTPELQIVLGPKDISRSVHDLTEAILNGAGDLKRLVLIGILTAGHPLAQRIAKQIQQQTGKAIPVGKLDITLYRDDIISGDRFVTVRESDIPFDINHRHVILVDDILFTGRTIRSALNGLADFGRPDVIETAVLIDRGHRELPILANYVAKTLSTQKTDHVDVQLLEIDGEDRVVLTQLK